MSTKQKTYNLGRHLATASALSVMLVTPAWAQNQTQSDSDTAEQQTDTASAAQDNTSNREHARNIEGAYENVDFSVGTGRDSADQPPQDQEIIERSFEDEVEPEAVSQVEAGTTVEADSNAIPNPSTSEGLSRSGGKDAQDEELSTVQEGEGVIAVDGEVIARTEGENETADNEVSNTTQQQQTASDSGSEQTVANESQTPNGEQTDEVAASEGADLQRVFAQLRDAAVINSTGDDIGTVTGVVLDNESGDAGLVVKTNEEGQNAAFLLAPVGDLTINDAEVTWQTEATAQELQRSVNYTTENREQVSAIDE